MIQNSISTEQLEKVVNRSPGSPAFARLADIYRSQGQVEKAISLCESGVKVNPSYPTGHLLLGRCYFEKERIDEALSEFDAVLRLDWRNLFALKIMGDIHAQKGDRERAARFYKRASDIDPSNVAVRDMFRRFEKFLSEKKEKVIDNPISSPSPAESITRVIDEKPTPSAVDILDETTPTEELFSEKKPETEEIFPDLDLPSQPVNNEQEIVEEPVHAPINRNIDDFNDEKPSEAPSDTEMLDLPPEMSGQREERVGEFNARKSVMNRMLDEQSAILDALPEAPAASPSIDSSEISTEEAYEDHASIDILEERTPAAAPEISTSTPGMDGYYSVDGGDSGDSGSAILDGLDNIELSDTITDDDQSSTEEISAIEVVEVTEGEVPVSSTVPATVPATNKAVTEALDPLKELMLDVDADDSVMEFLAAGEDEQVEQAPKVEPEVEEEKQPTAINTSGISSSAAGMDGYYNVSGSDANNEGVDILQDIDTVELTDALTETDEEPIRESDTDNVIELGNDIELPPMPELEVAVVVAPIEPESKVEPPIKVVEPAEPVSQAETVQPETIENTEEIELIKTDKKKAKKQDKPKKQPISVKVVSNVATMSLAEIYLRQGHREQALTIYKKLLKQDPANQDLKERVQTLKSEIDSKNEMQQ